MRVVRVVAESRAVLLVVNRLKKMKKPHSPPPCVVVVLLLKRLRQFVSQLNTLLSDLRDVLQWAPFSKKCGRFRDLVGLHLQSARRVASALLDIILREDQPPRLTLRLATRAPPPERFNFREAKPAAEKTADQIGQNEAALSR